MPSLPASQLVRFDVFELDLRAGELRNGGIRIRLQEQPLLVLQTLLEKPGEVVTREELQQRIWPADTFVDFDHGLHAAVNRLRSALNDSADRPRFVERWRAVAIVSSGVLTTQSLHLPRLSWFMIPNPGPSLVCGIPGAGPYWDLPWRLRSLRSSSRQMFMG